MAEQVAPFSEEHYRFLSLDEAVGPAKAGLYQHYVGAWWAVHPEKGLAFYRAPGRRCSGLGSPQCNSDERVTRMVSAQVAWPVEVRQIKSAWVPVNAADYRE